MWFYKKTNFTSYIYINLLDKCAFKSKRLYLIAMKPLNVFVFSLGFLLSENGFKSQHNSLLTGNISSLNRLCSEW